MLENSQGPNKVQSSLAGYWVSVPSILPCSVVWKLPEIIHKGNNMVVFLENFIYKTR